jgi:putative ABC transport system permease protein
MLYNYFIVAIRSVFRNKLVALINIGGLAFAMTCCLLIYLYISDEMRYDRYHANADKIYRVTRNFLSNDGTVNLHLGHLAPPFGPLLKNDFPDIIEVARVLNSNLTFTIEEGGEEKVSFQEPRAYVAEPSVFKIFTIPVVSGDPETSLTRPFTVMLSDKSAMQYFGTTDVAGKELHVNGGLVLNITGVYESFPAQSHWYPEMLISFSTLEDDNIYGKERLQTNWGNNSFATYILVNDSFDPKRTEAAFPAFIDKHMGPSEGPDAPAPSSWTNLFLQPLTDIHLRSHLDSEMEANGNINNVYMMGAIGLFIILIACFNFVNLSTARASKRMKEVGLRKVAGANKRQLVEQFLSESILTALIALAVAIALTWVSLGWLNEFTGKTLQLNLITHANFVVASVALTVLVGAVAGFYPALVLSAFKPALIVKGHTPGSARGTVRRILVVSQFAISIVLIVATLVTTEQLRFMNNRDLGYRKDQIVSLPSLGDGLAEHYEAFRTELLRNTTVKNVTRSSRIPTGRLLDTQGAQVQKGDSLVSTDVVIKNVMVDHDFFDTYGISIAGGRSFSRDVMSDDTAAFVLNESAVHMIGWDIDDAPGKMLRYGGREGRVIGVVKDFHFESLHENIVPMVFHMGRNYSGTRLSVAISPENMQQGLQHIEKVWKEFAPEIPFRYTFLSESYRQLYESEQKESQLFLIFAGLAIFIAALGLFGLTTFNTLQRAREIGIRKVLGASVTHIVNLLTREILILIVVANVIAWPVAWYLMSEWLAGFAYRIPLSPLAFILAGVAAVLLAIVTVSSQTIRAALLNPATTLRNE